MSGDLRQQILDAHAAAAAAWPGVFAPAELFATWIVARLPVAAPSGGATAAAPAGVAALGTLRVSDLYLACACASGNPAALARFDAACLTPLEPALDRLGLSPAHRADLLQDLRRKLFLPGTSGRPGIEGYAGRGELGAWVRVTAVRAAIRRRRAKGPQREIGVGDDVLAELPAAADDPELRYLRDRYEPEFRAAFAEALAALPARERTVLRHQVVDGLAIDEIAPIYRVDRATAARWLVRAREGILAGTRRALGRRLGIGARECESLLHLFRGEVDVSVRRLLGPPTAPPG